MPFLRIHKKFISPASVTARTAAAAASASAASARTAPGTAGAAPRAAAAEYDQDEDDPPKVKAVVAAARAGAHIVAHNRYPPFGFFTLILLTGQAGGAESFETNAKKTVKPFDSTVFTGGESGI